VTDVCSYNGVGAMAESKGHTQQWGRQMIPGAPLSWLWEHPNDGFKEEPYGYPNNAFPNYEWDAISLQPFDRQIYGSSGDSVMAGNFINLAKSRSPDCTYYIYERWPRKPDDQPHTADVWAQLYDRTYTGGWDGSNESGDFNEKLVEVLRRAYTDIKPVLMVPIGDVMYALNTMMKNGQISGYSSAWDLYKDGIHLTGVGGYIAGVTFFATVYGEDPRGMAVPSEYGTISTSLTSTIQEVAWQVITSNEYTGVGSVGIATEAVSRPACVLHDGRAVKPVFSLLGRAARVDGNGLLPRAPGLFILGSVRAKAQLFVMPQRTR
jgi:hypothetical protein